MMNEALAQRGLHKVVLAVLGCCAAAGSKMSPGRVRTANTSGCEAKLGTCTAHVLALCHCIPPSKSTHANKQYFTLKGSSQCS